MIKLAQPVLTLYSHYTLVLNKREAKLLYFYLSLFTP